jgi:aerobic-type carbon monoxide dehydrogenase small subunit (CoxS/CutS family)
VRAAGHATVCSSCLTLAVRVDGAEIAIAEGLPPDHPVVAAFVAAGALQCGYSIPGFVMMATGLLASDPSPGRKAIARHIAGNICRCGTYPEILNAIAAAASATSGG